MVFLVHSAIHLHEKVDKSRCSCTKYSQSILAFVDSPFSSETDKCRHLTNTIFKADVLHTSDRENELGCIRRKE